MNPFESLSRRRLLRGAAALGGLGTASTASGAGTPPPEAYQPAATKNWWYFNGHLYDPADTRDPLYDFSGAYVMEHGGDTAGHIGLFTFVENEPPDGFRIGESTHGLISPSTGDFRARYESANAHGLVTRYDDGDPNRWALFMEPEAPVDLRVGYTSGYEPRIKRNYQEGGGVGNVIFWNQATLEGTVTTPDGAHEVVGVGFLEHVWGAWSRVPQKGVDYFNIHLNDTRGRSADSLPTWGSVYCRRTFYHGVPAGQDPEDSARPLDDVGPDLVFSPDGQSWYEATDLDVVVTEPDGDRVPIADHRRGRPVAAEFRAELEGDGALELRLDSFPDATIPNPSEGASVGDVNEGAATVEGTVELPDTRSERRIPVSGIAQTEHQRYGPQYPY
jgi:hypothetical protein